MKSLLLKIISKLCKKNSTIKKLRIEKRFWIFVFLQYDSNQGNN